MEWLLHFGINWPLYNCVTLYSVHPVRRVTFIWSLISIQIHKKWFIVSGMPPRIGFHQISTHCHEQWVQYEPMKYAWLHFLMLNHWCDQFLSQQNAQSHQTHHKEMASVQGTLMVPNCLLYFCMDNICANTNQRNVSKIGQNAAFSSLS